MSDGPAPRRAKGGSMPAQNITVTPSKGNGNKIDWTMCHTAPGKTELCSPKNVYPPITVGKNTGTNAGTQVFTVTINDANKLGISFSGDPLWIQPNSKPKTHVIDTTQIFDVTPTPAKLIFKDRNDGGPVTLVYQLNFVGADQKPVTSIDPDIKNGGTTIAAYDQTTVLVAVASLAFLLVAIYLSIRTIRQRRELQSGGRL
jgi:hypothetical protein